MTKIGKSSPSPIEHTSSLRTFSITVDPGTRVDSIYGCIHEVDQEETQGIIKEVIVRRTAAGFSLTLDIAQASNTRGLQIYGFQDLEDGTTKMVARLIDSSLILQQQQRTKIHLDSLQ